MTCFDAEQFLNRLLVGLACPETSQRIDSAIEAVEPLSFLPENYSEFVSSIGDLIEQAYAQLTGEHVAKADAYSRAIGILTSLTGNAPLNLYLDMKESEFMDWEEIQLMALNSLRQQMISEQKLTTLECHLAPLCTTHRLSLGKLIIDRYEVSAIELPYYISINVISQSILLILECESEIEAISQRVAPVISKHSESDLDTIR